MEFLVTTSTEVTYNNKELQKATSTIFKLGESIKRNWFAIAYIVANVDSTECYKEDGFNTVHEWVESTFGIKKTASYSLLTIGKEYTRKIINASGKVVGYGTNLITEGTEKDFSKTQVEKMLPAGHELASELVKGGEITPEMSVKEITRVIKNHTNPEPEKDETEEPEPVELETEGGTGTEQISITVWDKDGKEYSIPGDILKKYTV